MIEPTQKAAAKEEMVGAALFLERPAQIDYALLMNRVGKVLGLAPNQVAVQKTDGPMVLTIEGDMIAGLKIDAPYPDPIDHLARFAHWWPDAIKDIARHQAHFMIFGSWSKFSRLDAHMRHLVLVRELVEQLPVIGILWGQSVLTPPSIFKGEFAAAQKGHIPFPLWVLVQFTKQPNGNFLISTLGMREFKHMEIETESSLPLDQTVDLVRKFGSYIIAKNPAVKDGDTISLSADRRIKVRHLRSFRPDVNGQVYWLELSESPSVKRPKGFFSWITGSDRKPKGDAASARNTSGLAASLSASGANSSDSTLAEGADVNARDKDGGTALMMASVTGRNEAVLALLAKGADVNTKDKDGLTALTHACMAGQSEVAQTLLANGANVNAKANNGLTVLIAACAVGHSEVVQVLLANGADVNATVGNGATALSVSASNDKIATQLMKAGAKK
jgi:hypothetical protein